MICALELERRKIPSFWANGLRNRPVGGQSGTPSKLGHKGDNDDNSARSRVLAWSGGDNKPIPIDNCPWCGTELGKASTKMSARQWLGVFRLLPHRSTEGLRVCCRNRKCRFSGDSPLPLVAVDEMLYQRLPAFVIATVDKFAALPGWERPGSCSAACPMLSQARASSAPAMAAIRQAGRSPRGWSPLI